ncbi:basic phospholipase A2 nigroxin B-like [Daphnia pulex]|uniref:basic phospholipase A2 nigroxin B-like n=1 Tax=Daphnia pulex TaxID=6669 RepID=UPI001EDF22FE|nr:basic phospholipase A2 nigroxin B-like [Daphnia pulex]XP_046437378.1 basic phospholipase A2 nigroxin B-like [Daphnia pulex]
MTGRPSRITYLLAIIWASSVFLQSSLSASVRTKRSIGSFGDMIRFTTRMEALLFNNYGNHCGSGDTGTQPIIDAIDRCCRKHDQCYESLASGPCSSSFFGPYFTFYTWTISNAGSNGSRSSSQQPEASAIECGDTDVCKLATCNCDRTAAQCMGRHSASYNTANKRGSIWDWLI